jgi:hypothetical protein
MSRNNDDKCAPRVYRGWFFLSCQIKIAKSFAKLLEKYF